jgi:hypothetical protein
MCRFHGPRLGLIHVLYLSRVIVKAFQFSFLGTVFISYPILQSTTIEILDDRDMNDIFSDNIFWCLGRCQPLLLLSGRMLPFDIILF